MLSISLEPETFFLPIASAILMPIDSPWAILYYCISSR